jgi:large subunit ribosomal protein L31
LGQLAHIRAGNNPLVWIVLICSGVPGRDAVLSKEELLTQHPVRYVVDVRCSSCGASFSLSSTAEAISTDVCSNCHPAYTGRERAVASGSRIARFNRRRELAAA